MILVNAFEGEAVEVKVLTKDASVRKPMDNTGNETDVSIRTD
jgi:hypothetical protein